MPDAGFFVGWNGNLLRGAYRFVERAASLGNTADGVLWTLGRRM